MSNTWNVKDCFNNSGTCNKCSKSLSFADIGTGKPVVAIRADMDALRQEVDGVFRANHSCGHDAHMTMVIGAIRLLLASKFNGTVRFIFQPAEEKGNGALKMVEKGAIMRNASIDLPAATKHGVAVCGTASMSEPPTELTWALRRLSVSEEERTSN